MAGSSGSERYLERILAVIGVSVASGAACSGQATSDPHAATHGGAGSSEGGQSNGGGRSFGGAANGGAVSVLQGGSVSVLQGGSVSVAGSCYSNGVPDFTFAPDDCPDYAGASQAMVVSLPPGRCGCDAQPYVEASICFPAPADGTPCTDAYRTECVVEYYSCGLSIAYGAVLCEPPPTQPPGTECCYAVIGDCPVGRPFVVDGCARVAEAVGHADWRGEVEPETAGLDPRTRALLAEYHTREGLAEHASVASFSRFVLECLALGAPADIVSAATVAAREEIDHARMHFALASAYGGAPVGPGELDIAGALAEPDLLRVAEQVARESCIAETVSALIIAAARDRARDGAVRAALDRIAREELEHVLLGWRFLAWALERGGAALRDRLAGVFAQAELAVGLGTQLGLDGGDDVEVLADHGYLVPDERRRVAREALAQVVGPAARALLGVGAQVARESRDWDRERSVNRSSV